MSILPKNSDITNIICTKCQNNIKYDSVSFQSNPYLSGNKKYKCILGYPHPTCYSFKCPLCEKGYGKWIKFDISLFPGFPDPDKCKCKMICEYCDFDKSSEKCYGGIILE